jgi:hypothetical protein
LDWALEDSVYPGKSLGITHIKLSTARQVIADCPAAFTVGTTCLDDLSDAELAKYIEENPAEDIRLSAYYLAQMKRNPHGALTDKQLFLLYGADTPSVRDRNATYGDDTAPREHAVKKRADHWDKLQPHLQDAANWNAFTDAQRRQALDMLASGTPQSQSLNLDPMYSNPGTDTATDGKAPDPPGLPSPAPGPSPSPPAD